MIFRIPSAQLIFGLLIGLIFSLSCRPVLGRKPPSDNRFDIGDRAQISVGEDTIDLSAINRSIGYRVVQISATDAQGKQSTTDVAIWYPTDDKEQPFSYHYGKNSVQTRVAENGVVTQGAFPLIIYSHGALGSGISSPFITETLARRGFIVAAPDHTDEVFFTRIRPSTVPTKKRGQARRGIQYAWRVGKRLLDKNAVASRPRISYRPAQVGATIDLLLAEDKQRESAFYGRVDEDRIGAIGYSFGAWTSVAVASGIGNYADARVKAVLSISSAVNENIFSAEELSNIQVPFMIMFGSKEVRQGRRNDRVHFYDHIGKPKYMIEIDNADHLTFGVGHKKGFPSILEYLHDDNRRTAIVRYTVAFMECHLNGNPMAAKQLHIRGSGVSRYLYDE